MWPSRLLLLTACLVSASGAFALDQELSGRFAVADPIGSFGDAVTGAGFGLVGQYGLNPHPSFTLGIGLHGLIYGSESTEYDLPLVDEFELKTTNNLVGGFLYGRGRIAHGVIQPYVEARLGMNYLWTESKLEDDDWWDDDDVAREKNFDDWAAFWSAGGGLLIRLVGGDHADGRPGLYLDLAVSRWDGAKAEYLTEGAIEIVDDRPVFAPTKSKTNLVSYELGVTVTF